MSSNWWYKTWLSLQTLGQRRSPQQSARPRGATLLLNPLEDRIVPTTLSPSVFTDSNTQGVSSLRNAIIAANADTGTATDTINLRSGTYTLSIKNSSAGGQDNTALTGDLDITSTAHTLIIEGQGSTGPKKTVINAAGLQDRVFQIVNQGTAVEFHDLVIQGGLALDDGTDGATPGMTAASGGGILNNGGTVTLVDVLLSANRAQGVAGNEAMGGGFYSTGGSVTMERGALGGCTIKGNSAVAARGGNALPAGPGSPAGVGPGDPGESAQGGGLYATGGTISLSDTTIAGNVAMGGAGGNGANGTKNNPTASGGGAGGGAQGGGLYAGSGTVSLTRVSLSANLASGGNGGNGGNGFHGGATLIGSRGVAGAGGGAQGGGLYSSAGTVTLSLTAVSGNNVVAGAAGIDGDGAGNAGPGGHPPRGGNAQGGGLFAAGGSLSLVAATVDTNTVQGGAGAPNRVVGDVGGDGGSAQGGGIFAGGDSFSAINSTIANNAARGAGGGRGGHGATLPGFSNGPPTAISGGSGGAGGNGQGGGLYASRGTITLTNDTLALNSVQAGPGGPGGAGRHPGTPGSAGSAQGGGIANGSATIGVHNTLIARNTGASGPDLFGSVSSSDHDLVGDGSGTSGLSSANGDMVGTSNSPINPLLGPLRVSAGLTATLSLLPGSPAIDAGDNTASPGSMDQRGLSRMVNGTIDIGAVEYQADLAVSVGPLPRTVKVGRTITCTITVTNIGPDAAALAVLSDMLPSNTTFVSFAAPSGWTKSVPAVGSTGTVTATMNNTTMLPPGRHTKFTLVLKLSAGTPHGTTISNSVGIADSWDPNSLNNSPTQSTTVS
jgi:uncharacterized repeat protein (TIGR01451 family)